MDLKLCFFENSFHCIFFASDYFLTERIESRVPAAVQLKGHSRVLVSEILFIKNKYDTNQDKYQPYSSREF